MNPLPEIRSWRGVLSPNARRVLGYAKPEWRGFVVVGLLSLFYLPLSLVEPYLLMYLIDRILVAGRPDLLLPFALKIIPIFLVASSVEFLLAYSLLDIGRSLHKRIKGSQLQNLLAKSVNFFRGIPSGNVLFSFFNDSNQIGALLSLGLSTLVMNVFFVIVRVGILWYLDFTLMLTYLAVIPLQGLVMWKTMKVVMRIEIDLKRKDEDLTARLESILRGAVSVKALGFSGPLSNIWRRLFGARLDLDFKNMMWKELSALVVVGIQALGVFAVFFVGVYRISDGIITLGMLLAFTAVAGRITPSVTTLISFLVGLQESLVNIERFYRIYDLPDEGGEYAGSIVHAGTPGGRELREADLSAIHVHDPVIDLGDRASIRVPAEFSMELGNSYLWHGPNGSGKTSLALAMAGLLPHSRDSIRFGGTSLGEFDLQSVRNHVVYASAEPYWPERTLAENFANSEGPVTLDPKRLETALRISTAKDVLDSLPLGLQTMLREEGHVLSRGENQRLLLALLIYRGPRVLLLDETLSQVSERLHKKILEGLGELRDDCLVVHVSQRRAPRDFVDRTIEFGVGTAR